MRTGDLCASGTLSGPTKDSLGSLLEISWGGSQPIQLGNQTRTFLEDGDQLILEGFWSDGEKRVGFGKAAGLVLPSI